MATTQENVYLQRINLTIDFIRQHLTDDLTLDQLARVAGFSPFHFHRIFKTLSDETVNDFVTRVRVERAAALLKTSPTMSITEIAALCGFRSAAVFSRAFKRYFGLTARSWDRQSPLKNSKNNQILDGFPRYTIEALSEDAGEFQVHLRSLPTQKLAYIRVVNSYQPQRVMDAYDRLLAWYGARGDWRQARLLGMSQDDPEITPLRLCRYDICLTVPDSWSGAGEVHTRMFPACTIAYIHCRGDIYIVDRAWQYLYRCWLPHSRYQPDNLPAMEIYRRQPAELGWERYDLDCAIPVTTLP